MIGFIGAALQLYLVTTTYNSSLSKARHVSFLDYERLPFNCGWLINFLAD
jgi:hypothetical protein